MLLNATSRGNHIKWPWLHERLLFSTLSHLLRRLVASISKLEKFLSRVCNLPFMVSQFGKHIFCWPFWQVKNWNAFHLTFNHYAARQCYFFHRESWDVVYIIGSEAIPYKKNKINFICIPLSHLVLAYQLSLYIKSVLLAFPSSHLYCNYLLVPASQLWERATIDWYWSFLALVSSFKEIFRTNLTILSISHLDCGQTIYNSQLKCKMMDLMK